MGGKSNLFFIFEGSPEKYAKNMYGIAGDPPPPPQKKKKTTLTAISDSLVFNLPIT